MANEMQQNIVEFEKNRNQLLAISNQKQQFQIQSAALSEAVSELEKTSEKKVFKAVGNILIQVDTEKVKKEISEKKESLELRIKTLQKQEDSMVSKLNKLKSEIQGIGTQGDSAVLTSTENNEKKSKK